MKYSSHKHRLHRSERRISRISRIFYIYYTYNIYINICLQFFREKINEMVKNPRNPSFPSFLQTLFAILPVVWGSYLIEFV